MGEALADLPSIVPRRARVFLVEDDPGIASVIRGTLEDLGCDVAGHANSGEAVLAAIGTVHPDLVLLDVNLAGALDGIETANKMRVRFDVPIVFVTGQEDEETIARLRSVEPLACVFKPFRNHQLRTAIELALHQRERERQQRERQRAIAITLAAIDDAVIAVDEAGRITFMNEAAEQLTELRALNVRGQRIGDVLHLEAPEDKARLEDAVTTSLRQGRSFKPRVVVLVTPAGRRNVEDGAAPLFDDGGRIFGGVMVMRELRDRSAPPPIPDSGPVAQSIEVSDLRAEIEANQLEVAQTLDVLEETCQGLSRLLALYRRTHRTQVCAHPEGAGPAAEIEAAESNAASTGLHRAPKLFERLRDGVARTSTLVRRLGSKPGKPGKPGKR